MLHNRFVTPGATPVLLLCLVLWYGCGVTHPTESVSAASHPVVTEDAGTPDAGACTGLWCPPCEDVLQRPCTEPLPQESDLTANVLGARGLYTSPSVLTSAPVGAALVADNVWVDVPGEYTTARGYERLPDALPGGAKVEAWTTYQNRLIVHSGATLYREDPDVPEGWTAYSGTYYAPSPGEDAEGNDLPGRVAFVVTQQAVYFTTTAGVYRLESLTGTPVLSGVPQGLAGVATVSSAGQALSASSATAYRYTWGRRAENGRVMLGAPSGRVIVLNTSEAVTFAPTGLARASNVVTVSVLGTTTSSLLVGQIITLTAVDGADAANFPTGTPNGVHVITSVGPSSFTYAEVGADATATMPANASFTSTETAVDIQHVVPIPEGIDDSHFLQVHRADEVPLNTEPSDEMYLVHEKAYVDMGAVTTSYTFTDGTPDALKADFLYTNLNAGQGIGSSHYRPPVAKATAVFGERVFYGNVELPERIKLTLLSVDSSSGGLVTNQGIRFVAEDGTIEPYFAGASEGTSTFQLFTSGTPAQNIEQTVRSLVRVINNRAGGRIYATYADDPANVGAFLVESRAPAEGPLSVTSYGNSNAWVPAFPTSLFTDSISRVAGVVTVTASSPISLAVGQAIELKEINPSGAADFPLGVKTVASYTAPSTFTYVEAGANAFFGDPEGALFTSNTPPVLTDDEAAPGGWLVSDAGNPDSVPYTIPEIAGDRYKKLLAFLPIGNALFLLKEDGLYRLTGNSPETFAVECVDPTVRFVAPRAVVAIGNRAYALTDQGVMSWTETTSPEPASVPIESDLQAIVAARPEVVFRDAFALSHDSKRRAYFWVPSADTEDETDGAPQAYVFNTLTDTWTRRLKPATTALVHPDGRLYLAPPPDNDTGLALAPARERNTGTNADYQEEDGSAVQAQVTHTPNYGAGGTTEAIWIRTAWHFAGTVPSTVTVGFSTPLKPTPIYFPVTPEWALAPGTISTPPTIEHSRARSYTVTIRHGQVGVPMRLLGVSHRYRSYTSTSQ